MKCIAIRADGSFDKGMGHIMRCMSIAKEFKNRNIEPIFLIKKNENTEELLNLSNIKYRNIYSINLESEIEEIKEIFNEINPEYTLSDSYWISNEYLKSLKNISKMLISIDDNNLYQYPSDVVINYNLHSNDIEFKLKNNKLKMLLGSKYCMLRKEFQEAIPIKIKDKANKILIIMGGTDINSFSNIVLENLLRIDKNIKIDVVVAKSYKNEHILRCIEKDNNNVNIIYNPSNMVSVMKGCDLAISAGGTTVYELGCLGIPTILIPQVDNQISIAIKADELGLMINMGKYDCINLDDLNNTVIKLLDNIELRAKMHELCIDTIDNKGTLNVVNEIIKYKQQL
ncbi:MAG: UDP-2,4-diacetamido-2,4,6-trideoxy-beta-L-altropyranose hydrolase [Romboutsia sp.]|uniref:UDP-2,4-diacetamido-2,4, 6-trideoxy-beta-L-altropyranose hydrolase n=1 Tax=Romboutsia sp. TaxID=1965302 RepID=UPI003F3809A4